MNVELRHPLLCPKDLRAYAHFRLLQTPLPITLIEAGFMRWSRGETIQRKDFPFCAIELITAGDAWVYEKGKPSLVKAGEAFLLHRRRPHHFSTGPMGFLHKRMLLIEGLALDVTIKGFGLSDETHIPLLNPARLLRAFREAHRIIKLKPDGYAAKLSQLSFVILGELAQSVHHRQYPLPVLNALRYMEQNMDTHLSLQQIADKAGLSVFHFNRVFKKHIDKAPIDYFLHTKIDFSKSLLINSSLRIQEVSLMVGFDNPLYFSTQFRKVVGISPRDYRKRMERG